MDRGTRWEHGTSAANVPGRRWDSEELDARALDRRNTSFLRFSHSPSLSLYSSSLFPTTLAVFSPGLGSRAHMYVSVDCENDPGRHGVASLCHLSLSSSRVSTVDKSSVEFRVSLVSFPLGTVGVYLAHIWCLSLQVSAWKNLSLRPCAFFGRHARPERKEPLGKKDFGGGIGRKRGRRRRIS